MATKVTAKLGPFLSASMKVLTAAKEDDDESSDLRTVCLGTQDKPHPAIRVNQRFKCQHVFAGKTAVQCAVEHSSYHPFPRGRENADMTFTVVSAEELASAGASDDEKQTLTLMLCPKAQVDELAIPNGKFYYLGVGDGVGRENYGLFRDVIAATEAEFACVTVWAYRTAPHMVRVVRLGDLLGIQQIAWPAQVQQRPNVEVPAYDERFLPLALQAAEIVTVDFDPSTFADTRKAKVLELLAMADTVEGVAPDAVQTPVATSADGVLADLAAWVKSSGKTVGTSSDTGTKKTPRKKAAKKVTGPPSQPLPDPVPDNVTVVAPKKRASRKTAAIKKSA